MVKRFEVAYSIDKVMVHVKDSSGAKEALLTVTLYDMHCGVLGGKIEARHIFMVAQ